MAKVRYSPASVQDMEEIGGYIADSLKSPMAALNTLNKMQDAINRLEDFPLMGSPLSSPDGMITEYRFLVCGNYLVFYRATEDNVFIDRVIYGRRDYMAILFGNLSEDNAKP